MTPRPIVRRPRCPGCEHCTPVQYLDGITYRHPDGPYRIRPVADDPPGTTETTVHGLKAALVVWRSKHPGGEVETLPRDAHRTLAEYATDWLNLHQVRGSTHDRYGSSLTNQLIRSPLARMEVADITLSDSKAYAKWLTGRISPRTGRHLSRSSLHHVWRLFGNILNDAQADGLIRHPFVLPKLPEYRPDGARIDRASEVIPPSPSELARLLAHLRDTEDPLLPLYLTAVHTGMRQGESLALTWRDVDPDYGRVHIHGTLSTVTQRVGPCKTDESIRRIPLPRQVSEALEGHREVVRPQAIGWPDHVFRDRNGRPHKATLVDRHLKRVIRASGVADLREEREVPRMFTWHAFRHAYITAKLGAEPPIPRKWIAEYVGVKPARLETYTHRSDPESAEVALRRVAESG